MAGTSPAVTTTVPIQAMAASVARMERSEIRVSIDAARLFPDFAALHPGYLLILLNVSLSDSDNFQL
jgi:hypothetical protein